MEDQLSVGARIEHAKYGEGIVSKNDITSFEVFFARGGKMELSKSNTEYEIIEKGEAAEDDSPKINVSEIEKIFHFILEQSGTLPEAVDLGEKWTGGTIILKPKDESLKSHELPIDSFFHKIVMVRDRLRVMEQNINSHEKLTDEDKVNLQQYITRIYGSLTSFNILFKNKSDHFVGSGK